ncbi:MAG TPA: SpoIIE family protein phosphatase [Trebonia sp.]|jgi:serine phosphatase RsbU (regulator of sigma subunit)/PAS domain-containing protein|nr:SpoIIE family protein phosphatase [Trebonia sp.]
MPGVGPNEPVGELALRRDALRQAAAMPGADAPALLEAVLTELDGAIDTLAGAPGQQPGGQAAEGVSDVVRAERHLLYAAFQRAPVPLLLLETDGTIRRANGRAAELLGAPTGYATGKPLAVFVDPPSRAALQTQLAAVARTGKARQARCRLLTPDGTAEIALAADRVEVPGEPSLIEVTLVADPLVVSHATAREAADAREAAGDGAAQDGGAGDEDGPVVAIAAMARRMDMVTAVTRLLLDNSTFSEAVTLQRCARLLSGEIATWAIVDMERAGQLRRQFAIGPRGGPSDQLARTVREAEPQPGTVPSQVHAGRKAVVLAHADAGALGTSADGAPLMLSLGATSLICVPISDGITSYGALTLLRLAAEERFEMADLALAEQLGEHLGIAIRVDRMFRRRSEVAEALQASLMPARLPDRAPGMEFAAAYIPATNWPEISGDFYDVFRHDDGWAVAMGDVCGKGQDAAAMTAAARHAIRALAFRDGGAKEPADVLAAASDVLLAGDYDERFVTAKLAFLRWRNRKLHVLLGSAGHPGPAVVRADGRVEILEGEGIPLGLFPDAEPSRAELELTEGDLLFFYSDGVTDARSARLGFLEDRLADELAAMAGGTAVETVRAVTDLVTEFSRGELRDDVTMLAIKVGAASG